MAADDDAIARAWALGEEPNPKKFSKIKASGGWNGDTKHGLYSSLGSYRFWFEPKRIYSYQMCLGVDLGSSLLLNGDAGPSMMTNGHMRDIRAAVLRSGRPHSIVPFSALRAAGVNIPDVALVATTPAREEERTRPNGKTYVVHFLGETLFRHGGAFYVSGLDRNDDPRRRNFYLAKLPTGRRVPKTVDEALDRLRPKDVPKDALRQGEYFLLPEASVRPSKEQVYTKVTQLTAASNPEYRAGVPLLSDDPAEQLRRVKDGGWTLRTRMDRHRATRLFLNRHVYVSGMLRDAQHGNVKLGDGQTWHRVVQNLAAGSWGATGDVD